MTLENTDESPDAHLESYPTKAPRSRNSRQDITTAKTDVTKSKHPGKETLIENDPSKWCFIQEKAHPLRVCRVLRSKLYRERIDLLAKHHICLHCVSSSAHLAKDCTSLVNCGICHSDRHVTALHPDEPEQETPTHAPGKNGRQNGEEQAIRTLPETKPLTVNNRCTEVCGRNAGGIGRSCAKICVANVYAETTPTEKIRAYVIIDDQSNYSLARGELFEKLHIKGSPVAYTLKTCSGEKQAKGRRAQGLVLESLDQRVCYRLPTLSECNEIPNNREEILKSVTTETRELKTSVINLNKDLEDGKANLEKSNKKHDEDLNKLRLQLLNYEVYQRKKPRKLALLRNSGRSRRRRH